MSKSKTSQKIERIGDESPPIYQDQWLRLHHDEVRFPDGRQGNYNRIIEGATGMGVACVPISPDREIGLVRVYRYPIGRDMWEIVRGYADSDDLEHEARREIGEEFGYTQEQIVRAKQVSLGVVHPNSGLLATEIEVFAFVGMARRNGPLDAENGVVQEARFLSAAQITRWISQGKLTDAITLGALSLLASAGLFRAWTGEES